MKSKYGRTLLAAILAGIAFSASAQGADLPVDSADACPADTFANPYYDWRDGGFVRDGWVCAKRYGDGG